MRTFASIKGHPIHPMLIPFPIAFLGGAFAFDMLGIVTDRSAFWVTASHLNLAGILTGLVAAVPGIADYIRSVPPRSSAKTRGTMHGAANTIAIALFALVWWLRGDPSTPPGPALLLIEALGLGFLTVGGWMGGTLVHRNFIGPEHRHAQAGKWKEESFRSSNGSAVVATEEELEVNQMKLVRVDGRRLVVGRTEDGWVAFDDRCSHKGGSLADGVLICGTVQCLWHGSQFSVSTGEATAGPAEAAISTYPVELSQGEVRIRLRPTQSAPAGQSAPTGP